MIRDHLNIHLDTIFVSFAMSSIFHIKALVKRRDNYKRFSGAWLWQLLAKGKDSMEIWISQIIFTCTIFLIFSIHQYPHLKIFLLEMAHYHHMHHQKIHQFSSKMRRGEHQQLLIAQRWKTTETLSKTPYLWFWKSDLWLKPTMVVKSLWSQRGAGWEKTAKKLISYS